MFVAIGVGARREGGKIQVTATIFDERPTPRKKVRDQVFTADTLPLVRTAITAQLQTMKDNEDDSALNAQVAGRELGRV